MKIFTEWLIDNLVYCGDTHSLVHRFALKFNIKESKTTYQKVAYDIIEEMYKEYESKRRECETKEYNAFGKKKERLDDEF